MIYRPEDLEAPKALLLSYFFVRMEHSVHYLAIHVRDKYPLGEDRKGSYGAAKPGFWFLGRVLGRVFVRLGPLTPGTALPRRGEGSAPRIRATALFCI